MCIKIYTCLNKALSYAFCQNEKESYKIGKPWGEGDRWVTNIYIFSKWDGIAGDESMGSHDYCQVKENWGAERGRKSSENNERKIGKLIIFW